MASEQLKRRALHRAFYVAGTREALARVLRLPAPELVQLLGGKKAIPNAVFLSTVEFILGHPEAAQLHPRMPEVEGAEPAVPH
ncbi:MAG: hypothetical protein JO035_17800 [Betaproteobacteria bacterium]|nr:hypothetical protein [Betaproteobacteria bacterium]